MSPPPKRVYLLTGPPGSGKTTLIKEAVKRFPGRAGGFYTEEIREGGTRKGFRIVTLKGDTAPLAGVDIPSQFRVSKYGVDIAGLERVGVAALRDALEEADLIVLDEIGKMELFSEAFREAVWTILESPKPMLGTIMQAPHPWADRVKSHPGVKLVELTRSNREKVFSEVLEWLRSVFTP